MIGHTSNNKLLIHYFQDSLTRSAIKWYNQLSRENVQSWTDLAKTFLVQYKYMTESAPDRISFQNMEKKATKIFREYAHK